MPCETSLCPHSERAMGFLCKDHLFLLVVTLTLLDLVGGAAAWRNRARVGMLMAALFVPADLYVMWSVAGLGDDEMQCGYKGATVTQPTTAGEAGPAPATKAVKLSGYVPSLAYQGKLVSAGGSTLAAV